MRHTMIFGGLLVLTACADHRASCQADATRDLQIVQALISDTKATIDRGYAIQTEQRTVIYTDFCLGTGGHGGVFRFCNRAQPVTSRRPVAVDLGAERQKLNSLVSKERELKKSSLLALQRCDVAFPAES